MLRARVLCAAVAALLPIGVAAPLTLAPSVASADAAGDKLLGELDAQITKAKSHYFEYDVENQEPGKAMKKLGMNVWIQGEKRLSELTAPADMKGTKVLILSPTQMYVYVPSLGKVRKIASSVGDQSTMGLTFSQDDFANQTYASMYTAAKNGDDKLTLTPKAGVTAPYGKLEITFTKDKKLISEIKYFNAKGTHLKTEARTGYTCEQDVCTPKELKMTDHTKGGHWSKFTRKAWKVNQKFADDLFTKRSLGE
jgi:hypothetical protein